MTTKSRRILSWTLTGLIGLMLLSSAAYKFSDSAASLQKASSFGLSPASYHLLGLIEVTSVLLFLFPRTGLLGTLLLSAYLGGAIAAHLQGQPGMLIPMGIEALVWLTAVIRFPELLARLLGKRVVAAPLGV